MVPPHSAAACPPPPPHDSSHPRLPCLSPPPTCRPPAGISPIRALIESGALQAGERKDVRLYIGVRSQAHLAFADRIPQWEAAGVKVIPVLSEAGQGYVQDAFAKVGRLGPGRRQGVGGALADWVDYRMTEWGWAASAASL
jgi:hypothetical protein